jgi:hypothetical protein
MKTKAIALLVIVVGLAVGVASAQSAEPIKFRTPFAFVVGDRLVPAGDYAVQLVSAPGTLWFRSADGKVSVFIHSIPLQKADAETRFRLVFHRYGVHYYISEIWTPGEWVGRTILQHPSELELAKNGEPQHVIVYVN